MPEILTFSPSPSLFGFGAVNKLPEALEQRGFNRVLIFTDPQIAEIGILQRLLDLLRGSIEFEVFDEVPAEPQSSDMERMKDSFGARFDAVIGLGGGSPMDFAKGMSIIMAHGGPLGDYLVEGSVPGPIIPVVCVPTTSGTGSQNTQTTVFTIEGVKRGVSSEYVRPVLSIVDPELTMKVPSVVTRNSGYDALMHACESFVARHFSEIPERPFLYQGSNPFNRSLALEAFGWIWGSYRTTISDGDNREARWGMSLGSHLAGIALSHSGLGLVHALASSLGGMVDEPHGVCLAACTNIGLSYNFEACERDFAILAKIMAEKEGTDPSLDSANLFIEQIKQLISNLDFPSRPSQLGIKKDDARTLLNNTLVQTRRIKTNPRPLDDALLKHIEEGI